MKTLMKLLLLLSVGFMMTACNQKAEYRNAPAVETWQFDSATNKNVLVKTEMVVVTPSFNKAHKLAWKNEGSYKLYAIAAIVIFAFSIVAFPLGWWQKFSDANPSAKIPAYAYGFFLSALFVALLWMKADNVQAHTNRLMMKTEMGNYSDDDIDSWFTTSFQQDQLLPNGEVAPR